MGDTNANKSFFICWQLDRSILQHVEHGCVPIGRARVWPGGTAGRTSDSAFRVVEFSDREEGGEAALAVLRRSHRHALRMPYWENERRGPRGRDHVGEFELEFEFCIRPEQADLRRWVLNSADAPSLFALRGPFPSRSRSHSLARSLVRSLVRSFARHHLRHGAFGGPQSPGRLGIPPTNHSLTHPRRRRRRRTARYPSRSSTTP